MAMDLVIVERVDPCATRTPGLFSYTVTGSTLEDRPRSFQAQTLNAWKASICEESITLKRGVWIGSRDTRYGLDIVTVTLEDMR